MLVCQCNGVSDRTIRRTVRSGACTLGQVARGCGAGASCGACADAIRHLIQAEAADRGEVGGDAAPAASTSPA